jgi:hypothetical protein
MVPGLLFLVSCSNIEIRLTTYDLRLSPPDHRLLITIFPATISNIQNKINIQGFFAAILIPVLSKFSYIFDFNMQSSYGKK